MCDGGAVAWAAGLRSSAKLEATDDTTDSPLTGERRVLKRSDRGGYMYYHIEK